MNHHIPIHPTFTKMTTSTRPHGLPPELPDPPTPPQGYRGVYREPLHGFYAPVDIMVCFGESYWQKVTARCAYETHNSAIEYIPLRKAPAGVADVNEGWEYFGRGPITYPSNDLHPHIAFYKDSYSDHPEMGWDTTGWKGQLETGHYALRIGSEIHHRHFDAQPEQPAPADESLHDEKYNERVFGVPSASEQPAAEEFRYFKDSYGFQWKMPVDGKSGWMMAKGGLWLKCISKLSHIDKDWLRDGFYETDADGNPLVSAADDMIVELACEVFRVWQYDHLTSHPLPIGTKLKCIVDGFYAAGIKIGDVLTITSYIEGGFSANIGRQTYGFFWRNFTDGLQVIGKLPEPITKVGATSNKLVVEPAKAREWWIKHDKDIEPHHSARASIYGHDPRTVSILAKHREITHVREVLPNESSLIEEAERRAKESHEHAEAEAKAHDECRKLLGEAVGHLRAVTSDHTVGTRLYDAALWFEKNFSTPEPVVSPTAFDNWYVEWAGVFANREQAAAMFKDATDQTPKSHEM